MTKLEYNARDRTHRARAKKPNATLIHILSFVAHSAEAGNDRRTPERAFPNPSAESQRAMASLPTHKSQSNVCHGAWTFRSFSSYLPSHQSPSNPTPTRSDTTLTSPVVAIRLRSRALSFLNREFQRRLPSPTHYSPPPFHLSTGVSEDPLPLLSSSRYAYFSFLGV